MDHRIEWEYLYYSESFDYLSADRASDSLVFEVKIETGGAEGVAAVDQYPRSPVLQIEFLVAEEALFGVQHSPAVLLGPLFGLLVQKDLLVKKELGRVGVDPIYYRHYNI